MSEKSFSPTDFFAVRYHMWVSFGSGGKLTYLYLSDTFCRPPKKSSANFLKSMDPRLETTALFASILSDLVLRQKNCMEPPPACHVIMEISEMRQPIHKKQTFQIFFHNTSFTLRVMHGRCEYCFKIFSITRQRD